MKKTAGDMRKEYDFTGGVRGKHHKRMREGYSVTIHKENGSSMTEEVLPQKNNAVILDPDVRAYFPDSESVNKALRCLIPLLPKSI